MQDQFSFVVLDGVMCVFASAVLIGFHPGGIFKKSRSMRGNTGIEDGEMESRSHVLVQEVNVNGEGGKGMSCVISRSSVSLKRVCL